MSGSVVEEAEVVVVGGGPSGSVAASKLADLGHDVLLIDQSGFPRDKPCGDGLTNSAVAFLERHGLGDLMEESQPIEDVRAVIGHDRESTGFYRPWPEPPRYARTTPRRTLDERLFEHARAQGARFLEARVDRPDLDDEVADGIVLVGLDERKVKARCVIAADGATSRMRRTSGIALERHGSHIYALRLYATTEEDLDPVFDFHLPLLYEDGLLAGYGWVFPVGERRANIGVAYYEPPPGRPRARIRRVLDSFIEELKEHRAHRLGTLSDPTEPIGAPIATQFSPDRCQLGNVIFAGEAARAADPLNGEGISFALYSGEFAAEEAHHLLRSGRPPAQGARIARRFSRLGADLTWPARMVASAPTGLSLVDRKHQPYLHRVRRVLSFGLDDPGLEGTEVHARLMEADLESAQDLDRANEKILDSLQTSLPFVAETMHREMRAGGGPFAAAVAIATAHGVDGDRGEQLISAAAACELLTLISSSTTEVSAGTTSDVARLSNTLAILTGELVLSQAIERGCAASPAVGGGVATAARLAIEALAAEAESGPGAEPLPQRYLETTAWRTSGATSLAARSGAGIAGANGNTETLAEAGHRLGLAWQIGDDIRDATTGDEVAGRPPGANIRAGRLTLPLIHALDADHDLAEILDGKLDSAAIRTILTRIRASGGLDRAAEDCSDHVDAALEKIGEAKLARPEPLRGLAELCRDRLPAGSS